MEVVYKELCAASFAGRLDVVQTLLRGGVSPSGRDASGLTALARASIGGHAAVASALIAAGADVNERDAHGDTPLHYAAFSGSESTVRVLLGAGAHAGALGADGRTPLASAAEAGHVAIVSVLVGAAAASPGAGGGAEGQAQVVGTVALRATGSALLPPSSTAGSSGSSSSLPSAGGVVASPAEEFLPTGGLVRATSGSSPAAAGTLSSAAAATGPQVLPTPPPSQQSQRSSLRTVDGLCDAAFSGDLQALHTLVASGVDVNGVALEGSGAGGTALHRAAAAGDVYAVELLVGCGANANAPDAAGCTPLHFAAFCGHAAAAHALLAAGCDASLVNRDGKSALDVARSEGRRSVVRLLSNTFLRVGSLEFSHGTVIEGVLRTRRSEASFGASMWRWKRKYAVVSRAHKALFLWSGSGDKVEGHVTRLSADNISGVVHVGAVKNFSVAVKRGPVLELAAASHSDATAWVTALRSLLVVLADDAGKRATVSALLEGIPSRPSGNADLEAERLARRAVRRAKFTEAVRERAVLVLQRSYRGHKARCTVRGWARVVDPSDGDIYWFNVTTGVSSWFPPGSKEEGEVGDEQGDSAALA